MTGNQHIAASRFYGNGYGMDCRRRQSSTVGATWLDHSTDALHGSILSAHLIAFLKNILICGFAAGRVRNVMYYAREHLSEPLSMNQLADVACLSLRQFNRIFLNATGVTPAKAVERLRLDVARPKIEDTSESFEKIAREVGFGTAEKMCRSCLNIFGRTPQELRRASRQLISL